MGVAVIAAEIAIPLLSLWPKAFRTASGSAAFLFGCYGVFHAARYAIGDPLPCSCFGQVLKLDALSMSAACLALFGLALGNCLGWRRPRSVSYGIASLWGAAIVLAAGAVVKLVMVRAPMPDSSLATIQGPASSAYVKGTEIALGRAGQPVLVIFGDYECPYCQQLLGSAELARLESAGWTVCWREWPLTRIHPHALNASLQSKLGILKGAFLETNRRLFAISRTGNWSSCNPNELFGGQLDQSLVKSAYHFLDVDHKDGTTLGVRATPALFVVSGNQLYSVSSLSQLGTDKGFGLLGQAVRRKIK